ncbi:hypothetical protein OBBRIDRAFT_886969 [Obba rivulosa]|uniref:Uncharacterized protein n=1 Tax=Obba rivulosa TaxID=1052685 RepID=A0A8E2DMT4_9APHY|nr:hypothetical protein OBBRIDRAFT_886969 [Obba rivulosa]
MALSTITSATYDLLKYSRCYAPSPLSSGQGDLEWQHFSNPTIRLVLDARKPDKGDLESFRLRIIWSLNNGPNSTETDQRDVVFEDLDLLSFSSIPALSAQSVHSTAAAQGLPLKAVFRGSVVGIRYQHPRITPAGATPLFRRFQVTFQSSSTAFEFISHVRFVCPCKANPAPPTSDLRLNASMLPSGARAPTAPKHLPQLGTPSSDNMERSIPPSHSFITPPLPSKCQGFNLHSSATMLTSSPIRHSQLGTDHSVASRASGGLATPDPGTVLDSSSPGGIYAHTSTNISTPSSGAHEMRISSGDSRPGSRPSTVLSNSSTTGAFPALSQAHFLVDEAASYGEKSLPSSSGPPSQALISSSNASGISPVAPGYAAASNESEICSRATATVQAQLDAGDFMQTLSETTSVYSLARADLEKLVAEVIREEGFAKLLSDLDSLWTTKGYLGR